MLNALRDATNASETLLTDVQLHYAMTSTGSGNEKGKRRQSPEIVLFAQPDLKETSSRRLEVYDGTELII